MRVLFGVVYCSLTGGTHHPFRLALAACPCSNGRCFGLLWKWPLYFSKTGYAATGVLSRNLNQLTTIRGTLCIGYVFDVSLRVHVPNI